MIGNTLFAMSVTANILRMPAMRLVMICVTMLAFSAEAGARDFSVLNESILRGSDLDQPATALQPRAPLQDRWDGLYLGGQIGRTMGSFNYSGGVSSLVEYILRNDVVLNHVRDWTTLPKDDTSATSYGGFIGYNTQWEDVVLGFELNYNHMNMNSAAADSMTRQFQDDTNALATHHYTYTATVTGGVSAHVTDFATARARAAWAAGQFLPYAFAGLAIGRGDVVRSATVNYLRHDTPDATTPPALPITPEPDFNFGQTKSEVSNGAFAFGYTAGVGIDVALMPNLFVRGEWEWIQFMSLKDVNVHFNTARIAVGFKF